jgi:hypothetical protein
MTARPQDGTGATLEKAKSCRAWIFYPTFADHCSPNDGAMTPLTVVFVAFPNYPNETLGTTISEYIFLLVIPRTITA